MKPFVRSAILACLITASLSAQVVTQRFNLVVDSLQYGPVFGVGAVPYSFSLDFTFDLTANPHVASFAQDTFGGTVTTGTWYVFGAESITAITGSFGTRSFPLADLSATSLEDGPDGEPGARYVFIADTDLTTAPSIVLFDFDFSDGSSFGLGRFNSNDGNVYVPGFRVADIDFDSIGRGSVSSIEMVSVVPEPSTYAAIMGACALGLVASRRRRTRASRG